MARRPAETKVRYDVVTARPKYGGREGDVWWHRVGNAIMNEKGQISIFLDSVPVPDPERENKVCMMLFERDESSPGDREPRTGGGGGRRGGQSGGGRQQVDDDEIPF